MLGLEPSRGRLKNLRQTLIEQRDGRELLPSGTKGQLRRLTRNSERLQPLQPVAIRHGVRDIADGLRRLSDRDIADDLVDCRVDDGERIIILETDEQATAISRRPHSMRQAPDWNGRHFLEVVRSEDLDLVEAADADVCKLSLRCPHKIDMVGDRAGVDDLPPLERRAGIDGDDCSDVLERKPNLLSVRADGDVRTEGAGLRYATDDLASGDVENHKLRSE